MKNRFLKILQNNFSRHLDDRVSKLFLGLALILCLSAILYHLFFKEQMLSIIALKDDSIDIKYYLSIFKNLEFSFAFAAMLLILIVSAKSIVIGYLMKISEKYLLLLFLIANVFLQLLIALFIQTEPIADSIFYFDHARRLFTDGPYTNQYGHLTAFWPVGLPAIYSLFFYLSPEPIIYIKIFNIVVSLLLIVAVDYFFKDAFSRKQRIIFLILFTFFPNNLFSVNVLLTDYLFTALLWIIVGIISRNNSYSFFRLAGIGILISLMSYLRPVGIVFPLVLFVIMALNNIHNSLKSFLLISITCLLVLSPWMIRNHKLFNSIIPVATNGGFNFLMGNHTAANGGVNFDFDYDIENPDEAEEERIAYTKACNDIKNNPLNALTGLPKKIFHSYKRGDSSITWSLKSTRNELSPLFISATFLITNLFFYLIIILSVYSLISKRVTELPKLFRTICIYLSCLFILLILVYVGGERYIIPILPIHFFLAIKNMKS